MKIFIVEDDLWYAKLLEHHLSLNPDYEIQVFHDGNSYLKALKSNPDVICLDFTLPDSDGTELLKKTKLQVPQSEVIIISGQEDVKIAIGLLKNGAYDYITKDEETTERLWNTILKIKETQLLKVEVKALRSEVKRVYKNKVNMVGEHSSIKMLKTMIEKAGQTDINVSITGETGTGKELVAKSIHYNSDRAGKFVPINVAAIPETLLESELFGYEKGAFTGANARKIGKFEEAQGGTIFLDEIAEMPLPMQAKLLRVIQERELVRLGGNKPIKLDVRIICATHKNLADEASNGSFRQDLHFRLIGLPISISPLRERKSDIKILANHFIENFCKANGMELKTLSEAAIEKLKDYEFPGNIRELKALIDLAIVLADGNEIDHTDIQLHVSGQSLEGLLGTEKSLKEYNAQIVQHFVNKYDKNVVRAAEALQIGKSTIYRMIANKEVEA